MVRTHEPGALSWHGLLMNMVAGAPVGSDIGGGRVLDPHWWAPGLALHERVARSPEIASVVDESSRARLARWRGRYEARQADLFAKRLAEAGTDEGTLLALLAEPASSLATRVSRPGWADAVTWAVQAAQRPPEGEPVPADWRDAFAQPFQPLISAALLPLTDRLTPLAGLARIDLPAVTADIATGLGRRLARLAARALVTELHAWRDAGRLVGPDSHSRFADFVRRHCEPVGLGKLFATYPVLGRLLAQTAVWEADALSEMLVRYASDRPHIIRTILSGKDPGLLRGVSANCGETHRRGRSVRLLVLADGTTLVYKPRSVQAQLRLAEMIGWLNRASPGLDLRTPSTLARPDYGWMESIANSPVGDRIGFARFYHRLGALLALLHSIHAADMHCENIIACGDQPIVVDAETIFHPVLSAREPADPAARALAASVARTGLLPSFHPSEDGACDISGIGGDPRSPAASIVDWEEPGTDQMRLVHRPSRYANARNRPRLAGATAEPDDYQDELLQGFRRGYAAIARHRAGFAELVTACGPVEVRVVVRPTHGYAKLLDQATHPDLLRDGLERDQFLDVLWAQAADDPVRWLTARHEAADLWAGDTPLFVCRPGARDIYTSTGIRLASVLPAAELSRVVEMLARLGEPDQQDQEWIILATIATRRAARDHHRAGGERHRLTPLAAPPDRLLAAACAVADQVIALAVTDHERVNWLGLDLAEDRQWLVMPMGAGLANGYLGVALFLAQLFKITGIQRYGDVARRAARSYRPVQDVFSAHPNLAAAVGCGGLYGLGGITYVLARLAVLLEDESTAALAAASVAHAATAAETTDVPDWVHGLAGCLAAMAAVHQDLGLSSARRLARYCADRLAEYAGPGSDWLRTCLTRRRTGFAQGIAGVAYSLARVAEREPRFLATAHAALGQARAAVPLDSRGERGPGWCCGVAGRLLAEVATAHDCAEVAGVDQAGQLLAHRPVLSDLSLCHGELGIIESLAALRTRQRPFATAALRHRAGLILDAIDRYGPACGTPNAVPTPGLLPGLAGIGYGLLRLSRPADVPSVLLLEPGPPDPSRQDTSPLTT